MSLDLTFRQKLIRIACSASVCGLSFSFVIGEVVDREAKLLRSWSVDPALIPVSYLPTKPLVAALIQLEGNAWRDGLVAANSLSTPSGTPVLVSADTLKLNSAAPAKSPIYKEPVAAKEIPLEAAEVEKLLVSIHAVTAKLSEPSVARNSRNVGGPEVSKSIEPKLVPPIGPTKRTIPREAMAASPKHQPPSIGGSWPLQGRILSSTAHETEDGHYEVGLFSKIDPDNKPVDFPQPQQILPEGQTSFRLDVPAHIERGFLFAEFVSKKTGKRTLISPSVNPWVKGSRQVAELYFRAEDKVASVAAAMTKTTKEAPQGVWRVRGTVSTMFASGRAGIAQQDVVVKVRGRKEATRTDVSGNFSLELPKMKGTLYLEVLKAGYHPSIVSVSAEETRPLKIEIASRHAIEQISQRLGASQGSTRGIFLGRALNVDGSGIRGMTAQLSLKADGPFYFDESGVATRDARSTTGNGSFLFLNVESGTGYLETALNGEAIAPLQVSIVDGAELIQKSLTPNAGTLKGRIFNPVETGGKLTPVSGARVRIDGASEWVTSDSYGAFSIGPLKWFRGERIALEVSAEKFNNHRYLVSADRAGRSLNLFAFPALYINRLARSMDIDFDSYAGLVIGKVDGPGLRMDALADHSLVNNAKDYYFDSKGRLRGSHEMTDPKFGTYIIFNVPKGRTILQGNDSSGVLRYSDAIFTNPASINIQMD